MGFFSSLKNSLSKSGQIQNIQKEIVSASRSFNSKEEARLMDRYFEQICFKDEGVVGIIKKYGLSKDDLYQYYINLNAAGLGEWIKGHYVPLSTLAYSEPLLYLVECKNRDVPWGTVVGNILEYWDGSIPQGKLLSRLK